MPQAIKQKDIVEDLEYLIKNYKYSDIAKVNKSPKDKVTYVDYLNTSWKSVQNILISLREVYIIEGYGGKRVPRFSSSTKSLRIKVGETAPKPVINFRSYKKSSSGRLPTPVQEHGSTFILERAVRNRKKAFTSVQDIISNEDTYNTLKNKIFFNYEDKVDDWLYTYYKQQQKFIEEYSKPGWEEFLYRDNSFVDFFSEYIKDPKAGLYNDFEKGQKVQKYTEWNPSDIYAVKGMNKVRKKLDEIFGKNDPSKKGASLIELNSYLIRLMDGKSNEKLVGISLKKIKDKARAIIEQRNTEATAFKDPHIEDNNFTMSDIKFDIDNIKKGELVSTYIKFGKKFGIDVRSSSSKYENLVFATQIAGASAQGGNAPTAMVVELLKKGHQSTVKFENDHNQYPSNNEEFLSSKPPSSIKFTTDDYEDWYDVVQKKFKIKYDYSMFEQYISKLYLKKRGPAAQTKLMTLHFFHDSLKYHSDDKNFWLRILYLGMKVGKIFAPHAKIYEYGN